MLKELNPVVEKLVKGKRVLDVGSVGTLWDESSGKQVCGRFKKLLGGAAELVGIDINEEGVLRARKEGVKNVYWCDATSIIRVQHLMIGLDNKKFDVVTCMDCIEHLTNVGNFLTSMEYVLNPDGKLFITTCNPYYVRYIEWMEKDGDFCVSPEHTCWFDKHTLRQAVQMNGYVVDEEFYCSMPEGCPELPEWQAKRVAVVAHMPDKKPSWTVTTLRMSV